MKIIDAFVFNDELDLLDIRLNILNDCVDYFVLVESTRTFQNKLKPLHFDRNKLRYSKFLHKIKHVVVDDMPNHDDPFVLEGHQRDAIVRGLGGFSSVDQIIVSDIDEIPAPDRVRASAMSSGVKAFRQQLFYYYVNCACIELNDLPWSAMCSIAELESPQSLRNIIVRIQGLLLSGAYVEQNDVHLIDNAGWHFSYLGGVEAIKNKIRSFSHVEYNNDQFLDDKKILAAIEGGMDLFGRNYHFQYVPVDKRFPAYILDNRDRYGHYLHSV